MKYWVIVLITIAVSALPGAAADVAPRAPRAAVGAGKAAPYVNSRITKERFGEITAEDMEMLRGKKILFASRSFGLNLCNGLRALAAQDKKYEFLSSYQRYDVFNAGGNLGIIPADAYQEKKFVHFMATYWPHTKRVEEVDQLMRQKPHEFGRTVDIVIIFFHTALPENFEQYSTKMEALQRDFPKVKFIYVTAGFQGESRAKENEPAHAWSEKVRARYKGRAPLYDLGAILSDDFRAGHAYCPEYSKDPAGVHPNQPAGEEMMAKGFLLVLRDACKWKAGGAATTAAAKASAAGRAKSATSAATSATSATTAEKPADSSTTPASTAETPASTAAPSDTTAVSAATATP